MSRKEVPRGGSTARGAPPLAPGHHQESSSPLMLQRQEGADRSPTSVT